MAERRTVLISDGNAKTIPKPTQAMCALGYDIVSAGDAMFVQTMALRHKPAVIVLGARVPARGTLACLRRLRASAHTASIPAITVASPGPDKQALLAAGADACLEPPLTEADILVAVEKQLATRRTVTGAPAEILTDPRRLSALDTTHLLDKSADEALDILTTLASQVLGVPVAVVSLVDDHRQFFKSFVGVSMPWSERQETPLTHSFCQWVVSSEEELVVEDARKHPVLRANWAVDELNVIAYAGVPLCPVDGQAIGSFCAIDGKPRAWSEDEVSTLRDIAQVVDAHTALNLVQTRGIGEEAYLQHFRSATQTASRGFVGLARLLRRGSPPLTDKQRHDLTWFIERHSHRLTELANGGGGVTSVSRRKAAY